MREGDTIDQYILQEKLKEDDYGEIWKAQTDTHITKTLKIPKNSMEELIQQAQINKKLDHENILKIEEIKNNYLVLENFEAENLKQKQNLTYEQKLQIIIQTARALYYAHNKGIIHSDLKPEHILVNDDLEVKITDFSSKPKQELINTLKTQDEKYAGTIAYMAPEQLKGQQPTKQSEIYSLSLILLEQLTERLPELRENPLEQLQKADLDIGIKEILRKGLEKDPKKRYKNMEDLTEALTKYQNKLIESEEFSAKNETTSTEYNMTLENIIEKIKYFTRKTIKINKLVFSTIKRGIKYFKEKTTKKEKSLLVGGILLLFSTAIVLSYSKPDYSKIETDRQTITKTKEEKPKEKSRPMIKPIPKIRPKTKPKKFPKKEPKPLPEIKPKPPVRKKPLQEEFKTREKQEKYRRNRKIREIITEFEHDGVTLKKRTEIEYKYNKNKLIKKIVITTNFIDGHPETTIGQEIDQYGNVIREFKIRK